MKGHFFNRFLVSSRVNYSISHWNPPVSRPSTSPCRRPGDTRPKKRYVRFCGLGLPPFANLVCRASFFPFRIPSGPAFPVPIECHATVPTPQGSDRCVLSSRTPLLSGCTVSSASASHFTRPITPPGHHPFFYECDFTPLLEFRPGPPLAPGHSFSRCPGALPSLDATGPHHSWSSFLVRQILTCKKQVPSTEMSAAAL